MFRPKQLLISWSPVNRHVVRQNASRFARFSGGSTAEIFASPSCSRMKRAVLAAAAPTLRRRAASAFHRRVSTLSVFGSYSVAP